MCGKLAAAETAVAKKAVHPIRRWNSLLRLRRPGWSSLLQSHFNLIICFVFIDISRTGSAICSTCCCQMYFALAFFDFKLWILFWTTQRKTCTANSCPSCSFNKPSSSYFLVIIGIHFYSHSFKYAHLLILLSQLYQIQISCRNNSVNFFIIFSHKGTEATENVIARKPLGLTRQSSTKLNPYSPPRREGAKSKNLLKTELQLLLSPVFFFLTG